MKNKKKSFAREVFEVYQEGMHPEKKPLKKQPLEKQPPVQVQPVQKQPVQKQSATRPPAKPRRSRRDPELTTQEKIWLTARDLCEACGPLILSLMLPGFLMCLGMWLRRWKDDNEVFIRQSGNFYTLLGILLTIMILYLHERKKGNDFLKTVTLYPRQIEWKKTVSYALLGAALSVLISAALTLFPRFGRLMASYSSATGTMFRGTDLLLVAVSLAFMAPLMEEMIFRGYMLNRLLAEFDEKQAVLITAAIFGLCHANPIWMIYGFFVGLILCRVSIEEDNILYSIVIHMGFNFPSVLNLAINSNEKTRNLFFGNKLLVVVYGILAMMAIVIWIKRKKLQEKWGSLAWERRY